MDIKVKKKIKFHQFIHIEKGTVNSAIIDFLKGDVYQLRNEILEKMERGDYDEINDFLESAIQENLIIEVNENIWVPRELLEPEINISEKKIENEIPVTLQIEDGANLELIVNKTKDYPIYRVVFYGKELPENFFCSKKIDIIRLDKNYEQCQKIATVDGNFSKITHSSYLFNQKFNSCWGTKIAITSDGQIHPCIYSGICIGDIESLSIHQIITELKPYWEHTKDMVKICKECELRYVCFDCREIARRQSGDIQAHNPLCRYNSSKGTWT